MFWNQSKVYPKNGIAAKRMPFPARASHPGVAALTSTILCTRSWRCRIFLRLRVFSCQGSLREVPSLIPTEESRLATPPVNDLRIFHFFFALFQLKRCPHLFGVGKAVSQAIWSKIRKKIFFCSCAAWTVNSSLICSDWEGPISTPSKKSSLTPYHKIRHFVPPVSRNLFEKTFSLHSFRQKRSFAPRVQEIFSLYFSIGRKKMKTAT